MLVPLISKVFTMIAWILDIILLSDLIAVYILFSLGKNRIQCIKDIVFIFIKLACNGRNDDRDRFQFLWFIFEHNIAMTF